MYKKVFTGNYKGVGKTQSWAQSFQGEAADLHGVIEKGDGNAICF